jgi:hypothetical protein
VTDGRPLRVSGQGRRIMARDQAETERAKKLLSDEEIRRRLMENPETQNRVEEVLKQVGTGKAEPGLTAEELADFLREYE